MNVLVNREKLKALGAELAEEIKCEVNPNTLFQGTTQVKYRNAIGQFPAKCPFT